ncbi:helix-turn-helix transcriptional regulator [Prolixibacter sp. SD074]|uniref:helix-turn-helix transcriptional regulator n=1 Tax=Prolixibacter sp. SD074 TaxID=2652391 RepID=UPI0012768641|nr:helix-turn-helix transcriptional regulator [Prolixibacter sp. SD074]GET28542.1 hypothetical protein SD074_07440 [Prolixibacter sp. SD074]
MATKDKESELFPCMVPAIICNATWVSLSFSFAGFLLYMFSKEKVEDEFIERLRYMSLAKSLLLTWLIASVLFLTSDELQLRGFYILQFQLFLYVVIYNYYKKWKFMVAYPFKACVVKNLLKVERAKKNLTQADLAKLVFVSRQTINAIESGKYVPSSVLALKIAQVFETSVNEIFELEESDWAK